MKNIQRVPKTELARNTRKVFREVQRGYTVLVENHGQAEAAILDIIDYRILRAFMAYHTHSTDINPEGIRAGELTEFDDPQDVFNHVLAHYLAGAISLGRAAELLGLPGLYLQLRLQRLDVPLNLGPKNNQEARSEVDTARNF